MAGDVCVRQTKNGKAAGRDIMEGGREEAEE